MRTVGRFMIAAALLFSAIGAGQYSAESTRLAWAAEAEAPSDQMAPGIIARRIDQAGSTGDRDADDALTALEVDGSPDDEFIHVLSPFVDLAVQNSGAATYRIDEVLAYTVTVTNNGPSAATGARLRVSFSKGAAYQVAVPSQGTCASAQAIVTCSLGRIPNGGVATVTIQVTPIVAYLVTSTAEIAATEMDPHKVNNRATHTAKNSGEPIVVDQPGVPI